MINMNRIRFIVIALFLSLVSAEAAADVVAVVSAKNPVTTLSKNQVVDIFLGKANRFPDGHEAVPIDQDEGSAAREEFYLKFADKSPSQIKAFWSKMIFTGRGQPSPEVPNGAEVKKFIAEHPDAIGYIDQKLVDDSVKVILTK
ncbi:phosphate ABC transporter substrate-binding protein [bacterium]|nr:phosphate ABC transporter substrate-binding protein [bacterium]